MKNIHCRLWTTRFDCLDGQTRVVINHGVLTTDHSASSYGIPVYVSNGIAYGPADISAIGAKISISQSITADELELIKTSGYSFH